MKTILAIFLLLGSTSLLADPHECTQTPGACRGGVPSNKGGQSNKSAHIPEPVALALFGLGIAGLVVARRKK
jgi:hypothetical protein